MLSKLKVHKNEKGFTLIELLIVIAIIGIIAAVAIPQFASYRARAHGAAVKSDLHNVYLSCKAYWSDQTPADVCTIVEITDNNLYGFTGTDGVEIDIKVGTENLFDVSAKHDSVPTGTWTLDDSGVITEVLGL